MYEIMIVKNTTNNEKNTKPISILDKRGLVFVLGKFSDNISKKTIIESMTVTANEILSPESQGIKRLIIIRDAVAKVGIIILST